MKSIYVFAAVAASLMLASCQNETEELSEAHKAMSIGVSIQTGQTRALVDGTSLPEGAEIGLFVVEDGNARPYYDGFQYCNVKATSTTGTDGSQVWTIPFPVYLSSTIGRAAAYYPYRTSPGGVAADDIRVEALSQTDYMYSGWVENLSNTNPHATFTMKHALAAVKIALKKQYYPGAGKTTHVRVVSRGFGEEGILNIGTGALSGITPVNTVLRMSVDFTLSESDSNTVDFLVVPIASATDNDLTVGATIDGNNYSVTIPMTAPYEQGKIFSYTLTLKGTELVVSSASIETWTPVEKTSIDILPA